MRQVHRAGEKLFVDYAGQTVPYGRFWRARADLRRGARSVEPDVFACATPRQTLIDWVDGLLWVFEYIAGVPELPAIPDNARALIADPDRYEPQASATLLDLPRRITARRSCRHGRTSQRTRRRSSRECSVVERWILARLRQRRFATVTEVDLAGWASCSRLPQQPAVQAAAGKSAPAVPTRRSTGRPCAAAAGEPL